MRLFYFFHVEVKELAAKCCVCRLIVLFSTTDLFLVCTISSLCVCAQVVFRAVPPLPPSPKLPTPPHETMLRVQTGAVSWLAATWAAKQRKELLLLVFTIRWFHCCCFSVPRLRLTLLTSGSDFFFLAIQHFQKSHAGESLPLQLWK